MFEALQDGLGSALKTLRGQGKLTESNMRDGLKLVEKSLLEADVSFQVVRDFMGRVSEQAVGEKVLKALNPSQQVVGLVYQELINLMGPVDHSLHLKGSAVAVLTVAQLEIFLPDVSASFCVSSTPVGFRCARPEHRCSDLRRRHTKLDSGAL